MRVPRRTWINVTLDIQSAGMQNPRLVSATVAAGRWDFC